MNINNHLQNRCKSLNDFNPRLNTSLRRDVVSFCSGKELIYQTRSEIPQQITSNLQNKLEQKNGDFSFIYNGYRFSFQIKDFNRVNHKKAPINYAIYSTEENLLAKGSITNKLGFLKTKILNYQLLEDQCNILNNIEKRFCDLFNIKINSFNAHMNKIYDCMKNYITDNKGNLSSLKVQNGTKLINEYKVNHTNFHLQALNALKLLLDALNKTL